MMLQIGYFSVAKGHQDAKAVHEILVQARRANQRDTITGLLVAGGGRYLQVIEGPQAAVEILYGKIVQDPRHVAVAAFSTRQITKRSFGSWSMAFRRQTVAGESNSFVDVLGALTAKVSDTELQYRIRYFAGAMMMGKAA
jgi:hypothetical protein